MADEPNTTNEDIAKQLITLTKAAELSGFTESYLRKLARGEKIWALKIGRNWVTTEKAILDYLATERKTGPKTEK